MLGQHKLQIYAARDMICNSSMFETQLYVSPTPHVRTRNARARVLITTNERRGCWVHGAANYKCIYLRLQI